MVEGNKQKVDVFIIKAWCTEPNCGGEMLPTGGMTRSWPPTFTHKCQKCGVTENSEVKYPRLEYTEPGTPFPENSSAIR